MCVGRAGSVIAVANLEEECHTPGTMSRSDQCFCHPPPPLLPSSVTHSRATRVLLELHWLLCIVAHVTS